MTTRTDKEMRRQKRKDKKRQQQKLRQLGHQTVGAATVDPGSPSGDIKSSWMTPTAAGDVPVIKVWGGIGSDIDADTFDSQLSALGGRDVELSINSGGGSVFDAIAMYNALVAYEGNVTVRIVGVAASAATFIAMAADEVRIASNALFMVHLARGGVYGTVEDISSYHEMIKRANAAMRQAYAARTELDAETLDDLLGKDSWMSAEEALEHGFVDAVDDIVKVKPHITPDGNAVSVSSTLNTAQSETALAQLVASVHSARSRQSQGSDDMKFEQWLKAKGIDKSKLEASALAALKSAWKAEVSASAGGGGSDPPPDGSATATATQNASTATATTPPAGDDGAAASLADEQAFNQRRASNLRRVGAIEAHAEQHGSQQIPVNASGEFDPDSETRVDLASHAIEAGWSFNEYRLAARREGSPQTTGNGGFSVDSGSFDRHVIEAATALAIGIPADFTVGEKEVPLLASGLPNEKRQQVLNQAMSAQYQGWKLSDTMRTVCLLAGQPYHGSGGTDAEWRHFVQCQKTLLASGGSSTISLPGILSNVANKALLMGYQRAEVKWPLICAKTSARDFKAQTQYRITLDGAFRKTGPDGKIQHGRVHESQFSNQLDTYGRRLTLNRQMRINDDLGSFQQIPQQMGLGGAIALESEVFALLLSNAGSFFSVANGNLISGADSALDDTGLAKGRLNFSQHVDEFGQPILASPYRLLTPGALEDDGDLLLTNRKKMVDGADTGQRNRHLGKVPGGSVASGHLDNTNLRTPNGEAFSGQSDTAWYLFANPEVIAAIYVSFLNGQDSPVIQSDAGIFDNDGLEIEGYFDFGCSFGDPAGATKSVGQ